MIQQCTSRYIKELTGGSQRVIHSPTFRTALLTLAKTLKQLNCPLMDKQNVVYTYDALLFSIRKERIYDICYTTDEL
jgi:hypothetical protein